MRNDASVNFQIAVARHHDGSAPRQWSADGFEGLASHDYVMPHGELFEMLEVFRNAPRQGVVDANHTVLRHRHDDCERGKTNPPSPPCQGGAGFSYIRGG